MSNNVKQSEQRGLKLSRSSISGDLLAPRPLCWSGGSPTSSRLWAVLRHWAFDVCLVHKDPPNSFKAPIWTAAPSSQSKQVYSGATSEKMGAALHPMAASVSRQLGVEAAGDRLFVSLAMTSNATISSRPLSRRFRLQSLGGFPEQPCRFAVGTKKF